MKANKVIFLCVLIIIVVSGATAARRHKSSKHKLLAKQNGTHISPEIIKDLKDFKQLIPTATFKEIVAKHYVTDGGFRTALTYLRSKEFFQLLSQLLNIPEIIKVLEFLHVTTANDPKRPLVSKNRRPKPAIIKAMLRDDYNEAAVTDKTTTKTETNNFPAEIVRIEDVKGRLNKLWVLDRPQQQQEKQQLQLQMHENTNSSNNTKHNKDDEPANANFLNAKKQQPLPGQAHHVQQHPKHNPDRYYRYQLQTPVQSFTSFVEEVLEHLPNDAYQKMIRDKCRTDKKFAEFYRALRSPDLKPLIDHIKTTDNVSKILEILNAHDVDVNALEPIAFQLISWGPNI